MTTNPPENRTPAPRRGMATRLLAAAGVAVLVVSLIMAYRENTHTVTTARDARSADSNKLDLAFKLYPRPRALPDIRFTNASGRAMTLHDFRGKLILLNVWATWCPPCRHEMPTLDHLQARLGGRHFEVVALSIDQGQQRLSLIKEFYLKSGINALSTYIDTSGDASGKLEVPGLPTTLLIDQEGREIGRKIGPAEWDSPEIVKLISGYLALPTSPQPGLQ